MYVRNKIYIIYTFYTLDRMAKSALSTIEELLEGVQEGVDDPEASYKLRSARQLLSVLKQRNEDLDEAIDEAIPDEEILENLRQLGYL